MERVWALYGSEKVEDPDVRQLWKGMPNTVTAVARIIKEVEAGKIVAPLGVAIHD